MEEHKKTSSHAIILYPQKADQSSLYTATMGLNTRMFTVPNMHDRIGAPPPCSQGCVTVWAEPPIGVSLLQVTLNTVMIENLDLFIFILFFFLLSFPFLWVSSAAWVHFSSFRKSFIFILLYVISTVCLKTSIGSSCCAQLLLIQTFNFFIYFFLFISMFCWNIAIPIPAVCKLSALL